MLWRLRSQFLPGLGREHRKIWQMLGTGSLLRKRSSSTFWAMLDTIEDDTFLRQVLGMLIRPILAIGSISLIFLSIGSQYFLLLTLGPLGRLLSDGCLIKVGLPFLLEDLHDRLEVIGYLSVVLPSIIQNFLLSLFKIRLFPLENVPKVLSKRHTGFNLFACVPLHHFNYFRCHLFLVLGVGLIVRALVCELAVNCMAFRKVRVQPYFYLTVSVHADHVLSRSEVSDPEEDFLKPIEGTQQNVQILRVRYVFNVAEPDRYVFDIYAGTMVGIAELFNFF